MKDFKKYYTIKATPEEVFLALTNPLTIHLWSGEEAEMSTEPGFEFSLFGGDIVGIVLGAEPGKKIMQQWFFDQKEPSVVEYLLFPKKKFTSLELRHTNIPDNEYEEVTRWWDKVFMERLMEFYDE
jgi:activator of HSP90 ATPase